MLNESEVGGLALGALEEARSATDELIVQAKEFAEMHLPILKALQIT